jgi:phosphoribosylamine--glycine ligase
MMEGDLVPVLMAAADSSLVNLNLKWHEGAAICLVLASEGYPGRYEKGFEIKGLDLAASHPQVTVFHAGTKFKGDHIVTDGGRVLGVTARGNSLAEAARAAYSAANDIRWEGMRMRRDIGHRALHSARTKQK